jgi:hypothetical protein
VLEISVVHIEKKELAYEKGKEIKEEKRGQ